MKTLVLLLTAALFAFGAVACEKKAEAPADGAKAEQAEKPAEAADDKAADDKAEPAKDEEAKPAGELTAEGTKYDPPIEVAEVPGGAWYCDMGTSHYARSEKGDGKCPLCKMDLKHKE